MIRVNTPKARLAAMAAALLPLALAWAETPAPGALAAAASKADSLRVSRPGDPAKGAAGGRADTNYMGKDYGGKAARTNGAGKPASAAAMDSLKTARPGDPAKGAAGGRADTNYMGKDFGGKAARTNGSTAATAPGKAAKDSLEVSRPGDPAKGAAGGRADTNYMGKDFGGKAAPAGKEGAMNTPAKDSKPASRGASAATAAPSPSAATTASTTTTTTSSTAAAPPATTAAAGLKPDTLVGEVIDIQCLARQERQKAQGGQDASAKPGNRCGTDAVRSGAPVGIRLRDGNQVYVVAMHNRKPAGRSLAQYVGREVTVAGWRLTEGGVPLVEITRVIRAEESRTSQAPEAD